MFRSIISVILVYMCLVLFQVITMNQLNDDVSINMPEQPSREDPLTRMIRGSKEIQSPQPFDLQFY